MMKQLNPSDVTALEVQPAQEFYKGYLTEEALSHLQGDNFTYFENGIPKAIVGMQEHWSGRALVWALIGNVDSWIRLHKETKAIMEEYAIKRDILRLEMTVEVGFDESERWALMLGFKEESVMKHFGPDGKDHKMMVRIWQQQSRS
jgi:hypothetical protein